MKTAYKVNKIFLNCAKAQHFFCVIRAFCFRNSVAVAFFMLNFVIYNKQYDNH